MTQLEIDIQVAIATGESLSEIQRRGFSLANSIEVDHDPEPRGPLVFDWDQHCPVEMKCLR